MYSRAPVFTDSVIAVLVIHGLKFPEKDGKLRFISFKMLAKGERAVTW
jgi:hypothetical protein